MANLRTNLRTPHGLTRKSFAVAFYLPSAQIKALKEGGLHEGVYIEHTYGGSPALYTGTLKDHRMMVLHQLATVRHARWAEAQGIDIVIAEGFEGGGMRGGDKVSPAGLVPPNVC